MNKEKWHKFCLAEQMGNIGSEFSRMVDLREEGDVADRERSFLRILEMIDLTISDPKMKGRLFEVLRLREVICDLFLKAGIYNVSSDSLKDYFLFFGLRAAASKQRLT